MLAGKKYQEELKQADQDHHTPTAGAMVGHITANLLIHSLKINQAKWFVKETAVLFMEQNANEWLRKEYVYFDKINELMVSEGEAIPTVTTQLVEYTMLQEDGAQKYEAGEQQIFDLIKDFDTQLLFITRAIKLAEQEGKTALRYELGELDGWIKKQIFKGQRFLGHELTEGLTSAEIDEDD
ncbi:hypothetical protein [Liquorilactobacillus capillatus]|uniref:Dna-binding ferritin-like protein (Oxidative damage protectant) n=1 Tax=Liquorilactobacillus capillatus DSM 19910 TaxID=1423731 RepID=A0A0R1M325_9LACO|nr:hypothetical protein [Liquorilactobacillus capillatus]KRL02422.1 dna-binding ferritin-like protein (oxidative damage protectant) [Liquorilactobacillus capillatus DSM 19910]